MSVRLLTYAIEVVGGPYDGAPALRLRWPENDELPPAIRIGVCSGKGDCNSVGCNRSRPVEHVAYWLPELEDPPVRTVIYNRQDVFVDPAPARGVDGRVTYVVGGLGSVLAGEATMEAICYG